MAGRGRKLTRLLLAPAAGVLEGLEGLEGLGAQQMLRPQRTQRRPLAGCAPCWADALLGVSLPGDSVAGAWESGEQGQV